MFFFVTEKNMGKHHRGVVTSVRVRRHRARRPELRPSLQVLVRMLRSRTTRHHAIEGMFSNMAADASGMAGSLRHFVVDFCACGLRGFVEYVTRNQQTFYIF